MEITKRVSTNGRYGLAVVHPCGVDMTTPQEGALVDMGKIEGLMTFSFTPAQTGQWFAIMGDIEPISGSTVLCTMDLQSSNHTSLVVGGEFFAIKEYGYKRRGSSVLAYSRGVRVDLPAAVMAIMGLIELKKPAEPVVVETPPIGGSMMEALKKAGIM